MPGFPAKDVDLTSGGLNYSEQRLRHATCPWLPSMLFALGPLISRHGVKGTSARDYLDLIKETHQRMDELLDKP